MPATSLDANNTRCDDKDDDDDEDDVGGEDDDDNADDEEDDGEVGDDDCGDEVWCACDMVRDSASTYCCDNKSC